MFAALGHGISDVDTAILMPLETGSIMKATVSDVKKGLSGEPGELHGVFDLQHDLGTLYANTQQGIFGTLDDKALVQNGQGVEIASRDQVHTGKATILSNIAGDQVEEYEIEILTLYPESSGDTRNLMIQVTDPRLLETTGGIVQGMSGSPILQDGRLVGAVTHVLINEPSRGYGILAENMVKPPKAAQKPPDRFKKAQPAPDGKRPDPGRYFGSLSAGFSFKRRTLSKDAELLFAIFW